LFHASYNSIMLGLALSPQRIAELADRWPIVKAMVVESPEAGMTYRLPVLIVAALLSLGILAWFHRLPYLATREEALEDARALQSQQLVGSE
jgi:hypothetical protein